MLLLIANDDPLPAEYKDHPLQGKYEGHRDCHAAGDLVLIYKIEKNESVVFVRVGTHSELFE
jgi:mRNA interferase YafQ